MSIAFELPPESAVEVPRQRVEGPAADLQRRDDETARLLSAEITERFAPLSLFQRAGKRAVDVVGALALLVVALPVLVAAVIAIKLDSPGPVLFGQQRVGRGGRTFRILKLRSMKTGGDDSAHRAYVEQLMRGDAAAQGGMFKLVDDPRITRVGHVLRRYSVDELPQLWNVLKGDMSLVGPRPALPHEVELYDAMARQRLVVKPGVTGLWQVSGRCELSFSDMIALDVAYWRQWSLLSDVRILLKTPVAALSGRGAA